MSVPVLIINRHSHGYFHDGDECLLPMDDIEPHLVTHAFSGVDGLDPERFPHVATCDIHDDGELEAICDWIIDTHGIRRIIALHEDTVLPAARLRTRHGIEGMHDGTAELFRDKIAMKRAVESMGVAVPGYHRLDSVADFEDLDWSSAQVVKSRFGTGSKQVSVVGSAAEARHQRARLAEAAEAYEIEEFITGTMYHCDAVVRGGQVVFAQVSRYLARPGDHGPGRTAGSMMVPDSPLTARILALNNQVIRGLALFAAVTHLEVFHTDGDRLIFLEVAARPGGGGIDRYLKHVVGIDIVAAAIDAELGTEFRPPRDGRDPNRVGGVVGFYPGGHEGSIHADRFAELGIVEHQHSDTSGTKDGGGPRHCTDYVDRYIVAAAGESEFLDKADAIRGEYGATVNGSLCPSSIALRTGDLRRCRPIRSVTNHNRDRRAVHVGELQ